MWLSDLDPRLPISSNRISNDVTIPSIVNEATLKVSLKSLVIRALGLPRNLAPVHKLLFLWKNAQKIAKKNKASDAINKPTPIFIPRCTAIV
jgi:hypothetical protein